MKLNLKLQELKGKHTCYTSLYVSRRRVSHSVGLGAGTYWQERSRNWCCKYLRPSLTELHRRLRFPSSAGHPADVHSTLMSGTNRSLSHMLTDFCFQQLSAFQESVKFAPKHVNACCTWYLEHTIIKLHVNQGSVSIYRYRFFPCKLNWMSGKN